MRSDIKTRLAALEAQRDRVLQARYDAMFARERVIVGEEISREIDRLATEYHWNRMSNADYSAAVGELLAPFQEQIDTDPEILAIWRPIAHAEGWRDYVNHHILRKPPNVAG